jgi:hypothetical protein
MDTDARKQWERMRAVMFLRKIHEALGGVCVRCGFADRRALQVDHVGGGGCKELKKSGNSNKRFYYGKVWRSIEAGENAYQLLCANCNWIKRFEEGESAAKLTDFFDTIPAVKRGDPFCERNALIVEQHRAGTSMAAIGREHGMSKQRVEQILLRLGAKASRAKVA